MSNNKHGHSKTPIANCLVAIKQRCKNPNNKDYLNYGGRGISICNEWDNNPSSFFEWAFSKGYKDGLQIDRIDNNKGYYPDNCRFVNGKVNSQNRRTTKLTEESVKNIREIYSYGIASYSQLAFTFNVGVSTIHNAITNHTWHKIIR